MSFFPTPFALGTSSAKPTEIIPVTVHLDPKNPDHASVGCNIGGIYYSNQNQTSLKDSSFATVIYNKRTKEVMVVHKKPEFLSPCFSETKSQLTEATPAVNRSALTNAFGSIKKQRWLREVERHTDNRAAVSDAAVINRAMYGQNKLKAEAEEAAAGEASKPIDERVRLLPPFNVTAARPADVYPFDKLVPARVLQGLSAEAETLASAKVNTYQTWAEEGVYQKCILERLLQIISLGVSNGAPTTSLQNAQCLALLSHMILLLRMSQRDIQRKQPLPDTPAPVARYLLGKFTAMADRGDSGRYKVRCITPVLRDKLIYHILVLILHCDNFSTVVDDLAVDFQMPCDRLRKYFHYLGCRVVKEETKGAGESCVRLRASLTTPVHFPDISGHAMKRKSIW
ncbi:unnamed protein product [Calicophoron daubneyi]|uniref:DNA-directed RNA polymerase I subunit RPA49 n=1 Tax=Calicophoron daubneyi TaxID=300641 RepID=A0AAV2TIW6_CALDB